MYDCHFSYTHQAMNSLLASVALGKSGGVRLKRKWQQIKYNKLMIVLRWHNQYILYYV